MGLDQYVYSRPTKTSGENTEKEIWYFRKDHILNEFMFDYMFPEQVYSDPNCQVLWFDLERIETCLKENWVSDIKK